MLSKSGLKQLNPSSAQLPFDVNAVDGCGCIAFPIEDFD
jgi:hypothetical protein